MHTPLYSIAQIRAIEAAAQASLPPGTLMRRAGEAACAYALELLGGMPTGVVLVLAGPGNNGGDALEVAANLAQLGCAVEVVHLEGKAPPSAETRAALARARAARLRFVDTVAPGVQHCLVIDGLFGIGLARPLHGQARQLVELVEAMTCPVLALDVPSGLDADTGVPVGEGGVAVRATHTITFIGDKPGLHTACGRDHAGQVLLADLGIDPALFPPPAALLAARHLFAAQLVPRRQNTHKGSHGDVAVVGGAHGMLGAAVLAARGALHAGAGRVFVASVDAGPGYDSAQPELMFRSSHDFALEGRTLVLGPGMGDALEAMRVLGHGVDASVPAVIDADGLNLVSASTDLQARVAKRLGATVVTPHPLEAARLLGISAAEVQADRLGAARTLARRLNAVVVLKGSGTVVAAPDGEIAINPTGNPGLATAGTGDVLAGVVGALLAQGWPAWEAAVGAVWMHGAAADRLVADGIGPIGLTAGELPAAIRAVFNGLVR